MNIKQNTIIIIVLISLAFSMANLFLFLDLNKNIKGEIANLSDSIDDAENRQTLLMEGVYNRINGLSYSMLEHKKAVIDLTESNFQNINAMLFIDVQDVSEYMAGIKIKGEVLNTNYLTLRDLKLELSVNGQTREISNIEEVYYGHAKPYEVYIPDVGINTRYVDIGFKSATFGYW